jgi:uncharacterized protein (TIGR02302 family)
MTDTDPNTAIARLERPLRLTWAGMWVERLVRAFWPLWSIVIATLAVLSFGIQDHLGLEVFWIAAMVVAGSMFWGVWHGLRRFAAPTRTEALARLDSRLPGNPIAALRDIQAIGANDPASQAVWAAHRARMAARAAAARAVEPDLKLASRDPYALRYVALTALVAALMFGSLWRVASVAGMGPSGEAVASGPTWEGWAQPPAYTGKPTLYLNDITDDTLTLPAGTRVQLRLYGALGDLVLAETVSARTDVPPASDPVQNFVVTQSGTLSIDGEGGRGWQIIATADAPPTVVAEGEIGREADGRFKQPFTATDDYGITAGEVTIALDLAAINRRYGLAPDPEPVEPVVLDLPLPISGDRARYTETLIDDLSKHIFANLPVTMTLAVTDASGQTGVAEPLHVILPGRRFFDPLAAALIEVRRDILWARGNAPRSTQVMKAITHRPEDVVRNERAYLRLRVVLRQLDAAGAAPDMTARDEMAEELWQIALLIEEGDLASARERLQRAQDRLSEAIENGASSEEIDELMAEMREALADYMRQLAQEAEQNPDSQTSQNGQPGMSMSQDQLQQMLDELQKLMEEGRTAEAQELMEQLRQFMENMQMAQGQPGQGQGQGGPGQQTMRDLNETLRDQQGLSDEAFRDLQDGTEGNEGQERGDGADDKSLAERQKELRDRLDAMRNGELPGEGTEPGAEGQRQLDRAGRAMEGAEQALRDGDLNGALDRQAEAMEAMRDGIRQFGEAMAQEQRQPGADQQGRADGSADPNSQVDPLGREPGQSARIGSDRNMLQGEDIYRRAQDLLEEIRRRSGEQGRPEGERDYLKRLLDLF